MSKKKEQSNDEFEAALKSEVPTFEGLAITSLKQADGKFVIVKIPVDIKNLKAGEVEVIDKAEFKLEATEKLKIALVRNGVI